jgi:hypothetical protein
VPNADTFTLATAYPATNATVLNANANQTITSSLEPVATDNTIHKGSIYTAAGFLSNGLPVLAWYDRVNQNLILSWGSGTPTATGGNYPYGNANSRVVTTTAQWQSNAVIIDTFKGTHVDMAVDGANNIHLAYYDLANGGLYYALIQPDATGNGAGVRPNVSKDTDNKATNIKPVKVDTYLSAGTKLMINVRQEGTAPNQRYVPYISYFHSSFAETKNSIRVAWRTEFSTPTVPPVGSDANDRFTGDWEVMTIPVDHVPLSDEFVCNGVPTGNAWSGTGTNLTNPSTTYGLGRTILVGYMTTDSYDGAILKREMW